MGRGDDYEIAVGGENNCFAKEEEERNRLFACLHRGRRGRIAIDRIFGNIIGLGGQKIGSRWGMAGDKIWVGNKKL